MIYVLFHGNCYDGFGAAYAAWRRFGADAKYIPVKYGDPVIDLPGGSEVYLLDFTYPRAVIEELRTRMAKVVVIDHHRTAAEDLAGLPDAIFDLSHSGAVLAWEYFHPKVRVPVLLEYVEDRDLWKFALPGSKEVAACVQSWPFDFAVWHDLEGTSVQVLIEAGVAILRAKMEMVRTMAAQARMLDVGGYTVPVANASVYFSEVGVELLDRYPDAPFAAYYFDRADGQRQWGMRSRKDFDCSAVAKKFGGGGHPTAAGFQTGIPA